MATGRFVTAPKAKVAIPASAAVAVMRSLRTSEAISRALHQRWTYHTFFAQSILGDVIALQPVDQITFTRASSLAQKRCLEPSANQASMKNKFSTHINGNDVGHSSKCRQPSPNLSEKGRTLNLLRLKVIRTIIYKQMGYLT